MWWRGTEGKRVQEATLFATLRLGSFNDRSGYSAAAFGAKKTQMFVTKHQDFLQLSPGSQHQMFLTKCWDFLLLFSESIQPEAFIEIWGLFAAAFEK